MDTVHGMLGFWGSPGEHQWQMEVAVRLLVAAILGGLVGLEREHSGRSAGFRTQLLVALGACLAMLVSLAFGEFWAGRPADALRVDPARVAYSIMAGIGFIGAGAIIRRGGDVRGITTAASLWCTAAVGMACGFGLYVLAVATTGITLAALFGLYYLDRRIPTRWNKLIRVRAPVDADDLLPRVRKAVRGVGRIDHVGFSRDVDDGVQTVTVQVKMPHHRTVDDLVGAIESVEGIRGFEIE